MVKADVSPSYTVGSHFVDYFMFLVHWKQMALARGLMKPLMSDFMGKLSDSLDMVY